MKILAFVDRIEDDTVVLNIPKIKEILYLPKKFFDFKIYEGLWLDVEVKINYKKTKQEKVSIKKLQQKLLKRNKSFER